MLLPLRLLPPLTLPLMLRLLWLPLRPKGLPAPMNSRRCKLSWPPPRRLKLKQLLPPMLLPLRLLPLRLRPTPLRLMLRLPRLRLKRP